MNGRLVRALVVKDLTLFFRNRFFALVSVLGIVAYTAIYLVMPRTVDEVLEIGLFAPSLPSALAQQEAGGLKIVTLDSEAALKAAVSEGRFQAGVVLPGDFVENLGSGRLVQVEAYFAADVPPELEGAISLLFQEFAYLLSGQRLPVQISSQVLGRDMVGVQIPPRDRMLPLFAAMIMLTETLGLASLISEELEARTAQALLVTPLTVKGLFAAKGVTGASLAFGQTALFLAATHGLDQAPTLILVALLLGSILVTGIGFLIASLGKDLMSVFAWGIPALVILSVPAFGVLFPGTVSDWAKVIPSYYLADTLHQGANYGAGWEDLWPNLAFLLGFDLLFLGLGVVALRRKLGWT